MADERVVAHLLHHERQNMWTNVDVENIQSFLLTLDDNLAHCKALRKELSRVGALRVDEEVFVEEANAQNFADFEVWRTTVENKEYYMATRDFMNQNHASWFRYVMSGKNFRYSNCGRLGDLVEAGLGLLYLANMFPNDLKHIIKDTNKMWRRLETSM
jgi:hypothetical protein